MTNASGPRLKSFGEDEEFHAYDSLPPPLRAALAKARHKWSSVEVMNCLKDAESDWTVNNPVAHVKRIIRDNDKSL